MLALGQGGLLDRGGEPMLVRPKVPVSVVDVGSKYVGLPNSPVLCSGVDGLPLDDDCCSKRRRTPDTCATAAALDCCEPLAPAADEPVPFMQSRQRGGRVELGDEARDAPGSRWWDEWAEWDG